MAKKKEKAKERQYCVDLGSFYVYATSADEATEKALEAIREGDTELIEIDQIIDEGECDEC
jgi:hypothetical protein